MWIHTRFVVVVVIALSAIGCAPPKIVTPLKPETVKKWAGKWQTVDPINLAKYKVLFLPKDKGLEIRFDEWTRVA